VTWVGVDVGGKRKGFDLAVVDRTQVLALQRRLTCADVVQIVEGVAPLAVGIDSPSCCAPPGKTTRSGERAIARDICGIRWTPDEPTVFGNDYYAWVVHGLGLYNALGTVDTSVIEVFPTGSWTQWLGARGHQRRSSWTRAGLAQLGLAGVPHRTNQDQRDAIAAAVTAIQFSEGMTQSFGEIVVPKAVI
jgi:predicted nuclease with RNAse H fold